MTILFEPHRRDAQQLAVLLGSDVPSQRLEAPEPGRVPATLALRLRVPAFLGSSPLWDSRADALYWIDVLAPSVNRFDPASDANETFPMEDLLGGVGLHADPGKLIVALRTEICAFDLGTRRLTPLAAAPSDHGEHRFNKGGCDGAGRFWTSSMHMGGLPGAGCLFCLDPERGLHIADTGLTLPNALAFSPDDSVLYLTDSAARTIFAYDFDVARGELGTRRVLVKIPPQLGRPAGLAVDTEGCLWSTHSDGWRLTRYSPAGEVLSFITLPVPSANGCGFGDADLGTLYIATARDRLSPRRLANAPLAGSLFSYRTGARGLAPGRFGAHTTR
jgi:sugar lactone lactonase YvrE